MPNQARTSTTSGRRWPATLALALALHAGGILLVSRFPAPLRAIATSADEPFEIDLSTEDTRRPTAEPSAPAEPSAALAGAALPRAFAEKPSSPAPAATEPAPAASNTPPASNTGPVLAAENGDPLAAMPPPDAVPYGIGAGLVPPSVRLGAFEAATTPPRTAKPAAPIVPRRVEATSAALGPVVSGDPAAILSPSSVLLAQVNVAARGSAAPRTGFTVLRIDIGPDGSTRSVTAKSASWAPFASAVASSLARRKVRLPPGKKGGTIVLSVDARVTNAPAAITGEQKATPCVEPQYNDHTPTSLQGGPQAYCNDYKALLPVERRLVSVKLLEEKWVP